MSIHDVPPAERLEEVIKKLKGKRSTQAIRTVVSEVLQAKPSDMQDFSFNIDGHRWKGTVYNKRNSLMGSIISLFGNKLFVVRGFPKIKYSEVSRVFGNSCVAQSKRDGTNLGIFRLPNGQIVGKTRMTPIWNKGDSYKKKGSSWEDLFKEVDQGIVYRNIDQMLTFHDYIVFGELYGKFNPGDFVKYSCDIAFQVFDIVDRKTNKFLPPEKVQELCRVYDIPMVEQIWSGTLSSKEVDRMEYELKSLLGEDGVEGYVCKFWDPQEQDVFMCKVKCEEIKEQCWEEKKPCIPKSMIAKAIRKTLENFPEKNTIESMYPAVTEELLEEIEQPLLDKSESRIRQMIRETLTPNDEDLMKLVRTEMLDLQSKGIDLKNKSKVMSGLAQKLGNIGGGTLYKLYLDVLRELSNGK
jgi:ATP-dependent RNA circularization protein (DNA/RNA ligase family)